MKMIEAFKEDIKKTPLKKYKKTGRAFKEETNKTLNQTGDGTEQWSKT